MHRFDLEALESRLLLAATAPRITQQMLDNRGLAVLTLDRPVQAATATAANCRMYTAGADDVLGTEDDVDQNAVVSYNPTLRTISLKKTLAPDTAYRIVIASNAIKGMDGVPLDGEFNSMSVASGDGTPGGAYDIVTSVMSTPVARFATRYGTMNVRLFASQTPLTVSNFLSYANAGQWDGIMFHKSVPNFVIQGGAFYVTAANQLDAIDSGPQIQNEPGISNVRGTIAMAKRDGEPDSATNQWFFNVLDNSANLNYQNSGFTVFGQIVDESGLAVMDTISHLGRANLGGDPLLSVPVNDVAALQARGEFDPRADSVTVNRLSILCNAVPTQPMRIGAVGDFNADGKPDLVMRNYATGANAIWYMNGGTKIGETALPTAADTNWRIQAAADFNGDGKQDIVLRNYLSGVVKIWLMNGATRLSVVDLWQTDTNWQIAGAADLTLDGKPDILWRNYRTGDNQLWRMNGVFYTGTIPLPSQVDTNWRLGAVADFYFDGKQDLYFHNHATGANSVWAMWGTTRMGVIDLSPGLSDPDWYLVGKSDFDTNKRPDVVWSNITTGGNQVWLMNGLNRLGTLSLPRM